MSSSARKGELERTRFREFVEAAGLDVAPASIVSREPPEPDILCDVRDRGLVAFELVEWVDPAFAEMESLALRGKQTRGISYGKTFLECIRPKLRDRTYESPYRMELVVWGGGSELELTVPIDPSVKDRAQQLLNHSVFQHLWVLRSAGKRKTIWLSLPRGAV